MSVEYDKYYQTENLFGAPYPELIRFYEQQPKGTLLDLGCGQGRDAIALARLGFQVTGIDYSKVGIQQLNEVAEEQGLALKGTVDDIYAFDAYAKFDYILLDSMFHFGKKERTKEIQLLERIFEKSKVGTKITICIQNTGNKVATLDSIIAGSPTLSPLHRVSLTYIFEDKASGHRSTTDYEMITVEKH